MTPLFLISLPSEGQPPAQGRIGDPDYSDLCMKWTVDEKGQWVRRLFIRTPKGDAPAEAKEPTP